MKQMIFDYLCELSDDPNRDIANHDVWPAHEFIFAGFDFEEIYDQIEYLLEQYYEHKDS